MAANLERRRCDNHPERYGHAVCMSCGKVVCQECATEWDGINYCLRCLAQRRGTVRKRFSAAPWALTTALAAILLFTTQKAMIWAAAILAGMWG